MTSILVERIELARKGKNPTVITKMESGWVVLGDNQTIPGYCLLLADPVIADLNKFDKDQRKQFLLDMTVIGDALVNVLNVKKINYSILDNLNIGLHAHIHPRYNWEKEEFKKFPPWKYNFVKVPVVEFDIEKNSVLIQKLKKEIDKLK